jgi:hypothetical protein
MCQSDVREGYTQNAASDAIQVAENLELAEFGVRLNAVQHLIDRNHRPDRADGSFYGALEAATLEHREQ